MNQGYKYEDYRHVVFTDIGQRNFISVRDFALKCWSEAGAVTAGKLLRCVHSTTGDGWSDMAIVDRLIEIGDSLCFEPYPTCPWQNRVFLPAKMSYVK